MPLVTRSRPTPLYIIGEYPAKPNAPVADTFVTHNDAAASEDCLDIAQVEAEAVIQPNGMLDHLSRKPEASV
jgi:hypothetical protein